MNPPPPAAQAMFEPENLANASPATVSRAGIIYVSDSELGWQPMVASWLQARPEREAAALRPCFDKYVDPLLEHVRLELRPVMHNEVVGGGRGRGGVGCRAQHSDQGRQHQGI